MDINKHQIFAPNMPMGLDMALLNNKAAFDYFYYLPEEAQKQIIDHTHSIRSKEEMQAYVNSFVASNTNVNNTWV